jgi:hypothetical protein
MAPDKEKEKTNITPEIDKLVRDIIEAEDEEEANLIGEIFKNEKQDKPA